MIKLRSVFLILHVCALILQCVLLIRFYQPVVSNDAEKLEPRTSLAVSKSNNSKTVTKTTRDASNAATIKELSRQRQKRPCAINLYGLPRAFDSLVLPSLIQNVIVPNAVYQCDYFVHYYDTKQEAPGRSGQGGALDPKQVLLLEQAVAQVMRSLQLNTTTTTLPVVKFVSDSDETFWNTHKTLIDKISTEKDSKGRYKYYPYKELSYDFPTTVINIIKMWHSIQRVWQLMMQHQPQQSTPQNHSSSTTSSSSYYYTRVAMLRSDVVYVTPIDIYTRQSDVRDDDNEYVVIPGFGRHPVSDRMVYGPVQAIQIWASERFARMKQHMQQFAKEYPGYAMHSERFVAHTLFPAMQALPGVKDIVEHDTCCFLRARVDESVWITDCQRFSLPTIMANMGNDTTAAVEMVLGRKCGNTTILPKKCGNLATKRGKCGNMTEKENNVMRALSCPKR